MSDTMEYICDLKLTIAELESDRTSKHYGPYGKACCYTGQLDAGPCWKCQIKKLEAKIERVKALRPETVNVGFGLTFVIPLERLEAALDGE